MLQRHTHHNGLVTLHTDGHPRAPRWTGPARGNQRCHLVNSCPSQQAACTHPSVLTLNANIHPHTRPGRCERCVDGAIGSALCGSRRRQISRSEPAKGTIWGCLRMEPVRSRPNVMRAHDPNRCERCAPEDAASFRFPFCTFFRTARYSGQSAAIVPIRVEAIPVANSPFASCHPSLCYLAFRSHF